MRDFFTFPGVLATAVLGMGIAHKIGDFGEDGKCRGFEDGHGNGGEVEYAESYYIESF